MTPSNVPQLRILPNAAVKKINAVAMRTAVTNSKKGNRIGNDLQTGNDGRQTLGEFDLAQLLAAIGIEHDVACILA